MNKDNFIKGLIGLGVAGLIIVGIVAYFNKEKPYLTWEEYIATIEVYNRKIEEIKADCENDTRCEKGKVIFRDIKSKKDVLDTFNLWIEKDAEDPNYFKK